MQFGKSLCAPLERYEQLADFAETLGVPLGEALGVLLDHAQRTGLCGRLALSGIEITVKDGVVYIKIDGFALLPFSVAETRSFAESIRSVANGLIRTTRNMDCADTIEVTRRGNGIAVAVHRDEATIVHRVFSRGVAKAFADRLDEAAVWANPANAEFNAAVRAVWDKVQPAPPTAPTDADSIEQLLGDLDIDGGDAVVEELGELDGQN